MAASGALTGTGGKPAFVGRERELAWLTALLARAGQGETRVGLIGGEPGIGKSTLLREFLSRAETEGWQTVWGRCSADGTVPLLPFATGLVPQFQRARLVLEEALPFLFSQGETDLPSLAAALSEKTVELAARRPLVFVIDDLQFADAGTLGLVVEYVRSLGEAVRRQALPVAVLVSHHPALPGDPFGAALERLRAEPVSSDLDLGGLSELEVHELVRHAAAGRCDPSLLDGLTTTTRGNPFFLVELLRNLERRKLLIREGERLTTKAKLGDLRLPTTAPSTVAQRLKATPPELLRPLQTAALLGDEFALADLATFHSEAEIEQAMDQAVLSGSLVEAATGFAFSHGIVRAAVTESMGPMQRRKVHREIASLLMERYNDAPEHSLRIASHVSAAGPWRSDQEAGAVYERAGDFAMGTFAWSVGLRHYQAALELPVFLKALNAGQLGSLYAKAARANVTSGDYDRARDLYHAALESFRAAGNLEGWGLMLLGWWRTFTNTGQRIPDDGEWEAYAAAAGDKAAEVRTQLLIHRAEVLWLARDGQDLEAAEAARQLAMQTEDPETRTYAATLMGMVYNRRLEPARAIEWFETAEGECSTITNPRIRGWWAARIAMPLMIQGDLQRARAAAETARELARSGNDWQNGALNLAVLHATAVLTGEFELARSVRFEAATLGSRGMYAQAAFILDPAVAWERMLRGEFEEALDAVRSWERTARSAARSLRLLVMLRAGEVGPVREEIERQPIRLPVSSPDFTTLGAVCVDIELAAELGDTEMARWGLGMLEQVLERGITFSVSPPILVARAASAAARCVGDLDAARAYLEVAEGRAKDAGAAPELGLVHLEWARTLHARRAAPAEVGSRLSAASETFRRLSMDWAMASLREFVREAGIASGPAVAVPIPQDELSASELEVCEELARGEEPAAIAERLLLLPRTVESHLQRLRKRLGIGTPEQALDYLSNRAAPVSPRAKPASLGLTAREHEVLNLVALGYSNQRIADELVISLHTAIRHVANILEKTGAANRTEAARLAKKPGRAGV